MGMLDYAQRFISTPGKTGRFSTGQLNQASPPSPLGPLFVEGASSRLCVRREERRRSPSTAIISAFSPARVLAAKGGAYSYLAHGKLMGGFALVAYPATYGVSGVMAFIVNQDGDVFQKDLGPNTAEAAVTQIKNFDPGPGWKKG